MKKNMKTAWVTGGSSGIGLALSKLLLKDKYQVCIFAHAGIEQAVTELKKQSPSVHGFEIDVLPNKADALKLSSLLQHLGCSVVMAIQVIVLLNLVWLA